jgi:sporulation protein YlmC with PRC-barrel domain
MEMRIKFAVAAATAGLLLTAAGLAQAQQSPPPSTTPSTTTPSSSPAGALDRSTLHEVKDDKAMAQNLSINASDLRSMAIYGSDGNKIGEVNNVLADSSNAIKAVTVDVGGFLGMGSREVVIPVDKLQKGTEKNRLQTAMTKTEIQNLEQWSDRDRGSAPARTAPATPPSNR